ncbi:MAG: hypothetical protein K6F37_02365 [Lachnospiraceae bacterium]|nr:hypothetical protein [Lachnospiraceae bacterium]
MKKGIIKALVLALTFLLGLMIFGRLTNKTNEDLTAEMPDSKLPRITLYTEDNTEVNELHGYVDDMNGCYMRDDVMLVPESRVIPVKIFANDWDIHSFTYEIRSLDLETLIARGEIEAKVGGEGVITADFKVENLLDDGEEYSLVFNISNGSSSASYYVRLIEMDTNHVQECIDFVKEFHDSTFDSSRLANLSTYMEPDSSADNSTLAHVTINSTLAQVGWGDFDSTVISDPVLDIKEINDSYNVLEYDYVVMATSEGTQNEYYNVKEVFRVRYSSERIYLLSYDRTMGEIFRLNEGTLFENNIILGIRDEDVEYIANEKGDTICFVQEGELWSYNATSNQFAMVFSFNGYEGLDSGENYLEHDIKIINVDETGSADFVVYGYMNAGDHEGQVGLCVYHYDRISNTIEEELFVPSTESYQILKEDLGNLMYVNNSGVVFFIMNEKLYRITLDTLQTTELVTDLKEGTYVVSDTQKYISWASDETGSETMYLMNMELEETTEYSESTGVNLVPLGFVKEDLVYGMVRQTDLYRDTAGNYTIPMYELKIVDSESSEVLKTYSSEGIYVSGITIDNFTMYLKRVMNNGTMYVETTEDTIMNKEGDADQIVTISTASSDVYETRVMISTENTLDGSTAKLLTPKEIVNADSKTVSIDNVERNDRYYVYAKGDVILVSTNLTTAITTADENMGTVLDDKMAYVWKRSKATEKSEISVEYSNQEDGGNSIAKCVSAMLSTQDVTIGVTELMNQGRTAAEVLDTGLDNATVLELSGCTLDEVLYYVNLGNPVMGMVDSDNAVLIVGYDNKNVTLYNPDTSETYKMGKDDATTMFEASGNVFLSYLLK